MLQRVFQFFLIFKLFLVFLLSFLYFVTGIHSENILNSFLGMIKTIYGKNLQNSSDRPYYNIRKYRVRFNK